MNNSNNEKLVLIAIGGGFVALVPEHEVATILAAEREN